MHSLRTTVVMLLPVLSFVSCLGTKPLARVELASESQDIAAKKIQPMNGDSIVFVYGRVDLNNTVRVSVDIDGTGKDYITYSTYALKMVKPGMHHIVVKTEHWNYDKQMRKFQYRSDPNDDTRLDFHTGPNQIMHIRLKGGTKNFCYYCTPIIVNDEVATHDLRRCRLIAEKQ